jgi:RimJ/RimL family protein N-acetyltransferase
MPTEALPAPAVTLVPLQPADRGLYVRLYSDPEVMRHIGSPRSLAAIEADFDAALTLPVRALGNGRQRRVVRGPADGIGLLAVDDVGDRLELGLMLLPAWQGRGIGRHAFELALMALRTHAADRVVQVQYRPDNRAMAALARTFAFGPPESNAASTLVRRWLRPDAVNRSRRSRCPCN